MSEITSDVVKHVANLARIDLRDEKKTQEFTEELDEILDYAKQLEDVQLSDTEPMFHALDLTNVMREDEARTPLTQDEALSNSKSTEDGQFKVPKML